LKKYAPYIFALLILSGIIILFVTGKSNQKKKLNELVTLRKQDKIPYGNYIAYQCLPYLFPNASIFTSRQEPGFWDSLSAYDNNQAYIAVVDNFNADADEIRRLLKFSSHGNDVFVSARTVSDEVTEALRCSVEDLNDPGFAADDNGVLIVKDDTLRIKLRKPYFNSDSLFMYPGRRFSSSFARVDKSITNEIGNDGEKGPTNFIHLKTGKGNFYLHLAPLAFSNYFLLHKNNIRYYEMALSVIDSSSTKVLWDEYFMTKGQRRNDNNRKRRDWFTVLMNTKNEAGDKPFKPAFWVLIGLLLLYILLEMRRKQRYIPIITPPRNDSMEFVKTIGRLYYDKGNHKNLARKMASYFQEHVRAKYKLATGTLDEDFIKRLQFKSAVPDYEIRGIVSFIKYLDEPTDISQVQLTEFYKQLETFYQKA
jgi:hypothetical protein